MQSSNGESRRHRKRKKQSPAAWIATIFVTAVCISSVFSLASSALLGRAGLAVAFIVLLLIVLVGIFFDLIGVSVMAADPKPFHSMASKKRPAAKEALFLLKNAEKVSSFCNDVVGDICGVISGSASAVVAVQALSHVTGETVAQLVLSALVAGLTIAGKAVGKIYAMKRPTEIIYSVAKLIYYIKLPFLRKKRRRKR